MTAADFWDTEADAFDEQPNHGLHDPIVRAAWADLLRSVLPPPPARVADLGSGTGSLSLLMVEAGHEVSGIDIAPAMVSLATEKVTEAGYAAHFSVGDASAPPWRASTFDVVLTRHVLWAMDDPDAALSRWIDLLAPQGRLVLIEGRWCTGAGMPAKIISDLVHRHRGEAEVTVLSDEKFWGGPVHDERFVVVSRF